MNRGGFTSATVDRIIARLAMAALRGVVAEIETTPDLAREVLARLLTPASTLGTVTTSPAPTKVIQCDAKQGRPKPGRPSRAKPKADIGKRPGPAVKEEDQAEAQRLTVHLLEVHGGMTAAERATGVASAQLARWRDGKVKATPETVARLRSLVAAAKPDAAAKPEEDDDAGASPAGEDD